MKVKAEDTSFYRETQALIVDATQGAGAGTTKPQPPATTDPSTESKPFPWTTVVGGTALLISACELGNNPEKLCMISKRAKISKLTFLFICSSLSKPR